MRSGISDWSEAVRRVHLMHTLLLCGVVMVFCLESVLAAAGPDRGQDWRPPRRGGGGGGAPGIFVTEVPVHAVDVVAGRPTRSSITLNVLAYEAVEGYVLYGKHGGPIALKTPLQAFSKGQPTEVVIGVLEADSGYDYQFMIRTGGTATFSAGAAGSFHTQRAAGSAFTFTVTADSHLDERCVPAVYEKTLRGVASDAPDFHIELGDTFMTEKHADRAGASMQYLAQRYYFGSAMRSTPLFLVLGNHDGEGARWNDGGESSLAAWSNQMREQYFSNPEADGFYTGNSEAGQAGRALQDYYAWEWGDALFVVLDPFWFTPRKRGTDDNWVDTLGPRQYQWLAQTLERSTARYRFVFIHNLVGGADRQSRGGAEAAAYYEWGGRDADGTDAFAQHRPGWEMPIHALLVRGGVTAVFHGHDHFFAKQERDGVVYQLVPQPGTPGNRNFEQTAREYGYRSGVILPSPGYLKVEVGPSSAKVVYVGSTSDRNGPAGVQHEYTLLPREAGGRGQVSGK